ncbi:hypothetical protein JD844_013856, partial [Phrynosoma platyrhinos]
MEGQEWAFPGLGFPSCTIQEEGNGAFWESTIQEASGGAFWESTIQEESKGGFWESTVQEESNGAYWGKPTMDSLEGNLLNSDIHRHFFRQFSYEEGQGPREELDCFADETSEGEKSPSVIKWLIQDGNRLSIAMGGGTSPMHTSASLHPDVPKKTSARL